MRKLVMTALFAAFALILSYIEALVGLPFFVPGAKLGLANLAVVLVVFLYGWRMGMMVQLVRLLAAGLLFGNLFSFCFSLAGALCSMLVMLLFQKLGFHIVVVSMTGGIAHNLGQLFVAAFLVGTDTVLYYFPILTAIGLGTGLVIGIVAGLMYDRLEFVVENE